MRPRAGEPVLGVLCCIIRSSCPDQRSRCVCFYPRFRFALNSSFCSQLWGEGPPRPRPGRGTILQHILHPLCLDTIITKAHSREWDVSALQFE
jgi:hypothetical protein